MGFFITILRTLNELADVLPLDKLGFCVSSLDFGIDEIRARLAGIRLDFVFFKLLLCCLWSTKVFLICLLRLSSSMLERLSEEVNGFCSEVR